MCNFASINEFKEKREFYKKYVIKKGELKPDIVIKSLSTLYNCAD